ncbi:hypothetical protein RCL1_003311 [Eukaryota sp. TZLM3-RCL]
MVFAAVEAADAALESKNFDDLFKNVDPSSIAMVVNYVISAAEYYIPSETVEILRRVFEVQLEHLPPSDALITALHINALDLAQRAIEKAVSSSDPAHLLQVSWILQRSGHYSLIPPSSSFSPHQIHEYFMEAVNRLELLDPKEPDSIYKSRLSESMYTTSTRATDRTGRRVDSAVINLANTYTNAFVHAGYGKDAIYKDTRDYLQWVSRHKTRGVTSAAAGLGLVNLWNPEEGMNLLDAVLGSTDPLAVAGGYLGIGVVNAGSPPTEDLPLHLLMDGLTGEKGPESQIMATLGVGIAYVNSNRHDIGELITTNMITGNVELSCISALSIGMIFVGSGDDSVAQLIMSTFLERLERDTDSIYDSTLSLMILGLALVYYNKEEAASEVLVMLESNMGNGEAQNDDKTAQSINENRKKLLQSAHILVSSLSQANSGNVVSIQQLLANISTAAAEEAVKEKEKEEKGEEKEAEKPPQPFRSDPNSLLQSLMSGGRGPQARPSGPTQKPSKPTLLFSPVAASVLGIALITGSEAIGHELGLRLFSTINQYAVLEAKRAVPAALAFMYWSQPKIQVVDALIRLSHDSDVNVACAGIISLGIVGQGTNSTRVAQNLRRLSEHYEKDSTRVLACRIAQGLLHTGKGLLDACPFTMESKVLSPRYIASCLPLLIGLMDSEGLFLHRMHVLLYCLAPALKSRAMVTVDREGKSVSMSARVGKAIDVTGLPGRPLKVTGFQTHDTPVVVPRGERADFGDESKKVYCEVLEGVVVVSE